MDQFTKRLREIDSLMDEGSIDTAIRVSGELLADTDRQWTSLRNNCQPTGEALLHGAVAGSRHVESLLMADLPGDAFATSLMLLLKEIIDGSDDRRLRSPRLVLIYLAIKSLTRLSENIDRENDGIGADHASAILTCLGSMLYDCYILMQSSGESNPYMRPVYEMLKELRDIGAIQYPAVKSGDRTIQTDDRRGLLGDIIGRAQAMGWFVCD